MSATGLVAEIARALPAAPEGCNPSTNVSYWTVDPSVLPRLAVEQPSARYKPGHWIVWDDAEAHLSVQVSYVGDEDDEQERKRLSDSAAAAEDFHVEDDGGDEEDPS